MNIGVSGKRSWKSMLSSLFLEVVAFQLTTLFPLRQLQESFFPSNQYQLFSTSAFQNISQPKQDEQRSYSYRGCRPSAGTMDPPFTQHTHHDMVKELIRLRFESFPSRFICVHACIYIYIADMI